MANQVVENVFLSGFLKNSNNRFDTKKHFYFIGGFSGRI